MENNLNLRDLFFNVQNAYTESLHEIDSFGFDTQDSSPKPTPFRVHSNYSLNLTKDNVQRGELPMTSGGCPMYDYKYGDDLADFLQRGNVKPGDSIKGNINEDVGP